MNKMIYIIILIALIVVVTVAITMLNNEKPAVEQSPEVFKPLDTGNIEIINKICDESHQGDKIYRAYNSEGVLGGYKIINDSENPDVAFTKWIDKDGNDFAYMSPISKPTQESLKAAGEFDEEFTKLAEIDCINIDKK